MGYGIGTRSDAEVNRDFRHGFTTGNDMQMHYVIGGQGSETAVLLHGWPGNWYQYGGILDGLLRPERSVIAVDLPGKGDSRGELPDYKTTMAGYLHQLLAGLGLWRNVHLVGHDFGRGVAYALADQYREGGSVAPSVQRRNGSS